MEFCAFPGCDNPKSKKAAKGLCNSHYWQMHKGRELAPLSYRRNRCEPWLEEHKDNESDECLIWPFSRNVSGYASVKYRGAQQSACPVMCTLAHGPKPAPEYEAAHSCGKGHLGCINPQHLRWATPKENAEDKKLHGTHRAGSDIPSSKLTEEDVSEIRALKGVLSQAKIGALFGVGQSAIFKIHHGLRWSHLNG